MSAEDSEAVPPGVVSLVMPQAAHTQDIATAADNLNEQIDVANVSPGLSASASGRSQELSIMPTLECRSGPNELQVPPRNFN